MSSKSRRVVDRAQVLRETTEHGGVASIGASSESDEGTNFTAEEMLLFMGKESLRSFAEDAGIEATQSASETVKKLPAEEGVGAKKIEQEREKTAFQLFAPKRTMIPRELSTLSYRQKQRLAMEYRMRSKMCGASLNEVLTRKRDAILNQYEDHLLAHQNELDSSEYQEDFESGEMQSPRKRARITENLDKGELPESDNQIGQQEYHPQIEGHSEPESTDAPLVPKDPSASHTTSRGMNSGLMPFAYPTRYLWPTQGVVCSKEWWPEMGFETQDSRKEGNPLLKQHRGSELHSKPRPLASPVTTASSAEEEKPASPTKFMLLEPSRPVHVSTIPRHVPSPTSIRPFYVLTNAEHRDKVPSATPSSLKLASPLYALSSPFVYRPISPRYVPFPPAIDGTASLSSPNRVPIPSSTLAWSHEEQVQSYSASVELPKITSPEYNPVSPRYVPFRSPLWSSGYIPPSPTLPDIRPVNATTAAPSSPLGYHPISPRYVPFPPPSSPCYVPPSPTLSANRPVSERSPQDASLHASYQREYKRRKTFTRLSPSPEGQSRRQIDDQVADDSAKYTLRRNPDMWKRGQPSYTSGAPYISRGGNLMNAFVSWGHHNVAEGQSDDEEWEANASNAHPYSSWGTHQTVVDRATVPSPSSRDGNVENSLMPKTGNGGGTKAIFTTPKVANNVERWWNPNTELENSCGSVSVGADEKEEKEKSEFFGTGGEAGQTEATAGAADWTSRTPRGPRENTGFSFRGVWYCEFPVTGLGAEKHQRDRKIDKRRPETWWRHDPESPTPVSRTHSKSVDREELVPLSLDISTSGEVE